MKFLKYAYIILGVIFILDSRIQAQDMDKVRKEAAYLTFEECLQIAMDNNLDIKIAKLENWIAGTEDTYAKSIYDMMLSGKISYMQDETEQSNIVFPTKSINNEYTFGVDQKLPTGTTLSFDYRNYRDWDNSIFTVLNPSYTADIEFTVKQAMLKNILGIQDRGSVHLAKMNVEISDLDTYRKIEITIAGVGKKYWNLVFAVSRLKIQQELLKKAIDMQKINEKHIEYGFIEEKDIIASDANVRQKEIGVLVAENGLVDAMKELKLILNKDFDNYPILPVDNFNKPEKSPELLSSLKTAIENRKDLKAMKRKVDKKKLTLVMKENNLLPELDVTASYTANGVDRKVTKAHGTLTTMKYPKYYLGAEVTIPFENSKEVSEYEKAKYDKMKVLDEYKYLEKKILTEVDEKVRATLLNIQRVERFGRIKELQKLKLEQEEGQYKIGRSSSKDVIDFQNDVRNAELEELLSYLEYYYSAIDLEVSKDTLLNKLGIKLNEPR